MTLISVRLARSHLDVIRSLADEHEVVDGINFRDAPLLSDVLIDSSAVGWMVCINSWRGLMGTAENLAALCRSLVTIGRKREREIAGRIKLRALEKGAPAGDWPGEPPKPKPHAPRSIEDVARAWASGKSMKAGNVATDGRDLYSWRLRIGRTYGGKKIAIDYRQRVSRSTSMHVGVAIQHADRTEKPERRPR